MNLVAKIITWVFGCVLFINAALFVPQAYKIWITKSAEDLSLITFGGFILSNLVATAYGFVQKDKVLIFGFS